MYHIAIHLEFIHVDTYSTRCYKNIETKKEVRIAIKRKETSRQL